LHNIVFQKLDFIIFKMMVTHKTPFIQIQNMLL
jgi:hypothetical protein